VVAIARRAGELPTVMGQFANGQLSLDQVAVVARYAPAHVEASVAELAVHASVPQLRRALSRYSFDPPRPQGQDDRDRQSATETGGGETGSGDGETGDSGPGGGETADAGTGDPGSAGAGAGDPPSWDGYALEDDRASAPAELSMGHDEDGRFTLRFSAPADLGALVQAALNEAKDALFRAGRPEVTFGDALVEVARRSLGAVESINRRDAYRTYVHLAPPQAGGTPSEGGWLTGRPRLPAHLAEKLTCEGILQPVWHTGGAPVNVGRAQRIVPARTRRLVEDRDRGCRYPGCAATAHVECHHILHVRREAPVLPDGGVRPPSPCCRSSPVKLRAA
jgi:hypothetical protein